MRVAESFKGGDIRIPTSVSTSPWCLRKELYQADWPKTTLYRQLGTSVERGRLEDRALEAGRAHPSRDLDVGGPSSQRCRPLRVSEIGPGQSLLARDVGCAGERADPVGPVIRPSDVGRLRRDFDEAAVGDSGAPRFFHSQVSAGFAPCPRRGRGSVQTRRKSSRHAGPGSRVPRRRSLSSTTGGADGRWGGTVRHRSPRIVCRKASGQFHGAPEPPVGSGRVRLAEREGFEPPGLTPNGFQDRRNRPLCHLSGADCTAGLPTGHRPTVWLSFRTDSRRRIARSRCLAWSTIGCG